MLWFKLGWRNLWRNKRRTIIEVVSIGGTVFLGVAWNNLAMGSYEKMINDGVKMGSGHIGFYHPDYLEMRKTEQVIDTSRLVDELEREPDVLGVYPRLNVPGLVRSSHDSRATILMGIEFEREVAVNPLLQKKRIIEGEMPSDKHERGALIGVILARELDLGVGKKFVIMVQGKDGEIVSSLLRVTGILKSNIREIDAAAVLLDREKLGAIIGYEHSAHEVAVLFRHYEYAKKMYPKFKDIAGRYPGTEAFYWEEAMSELADAVNYDHAALKVTIAILYVIVGIGTINTLLMSVMERTREFGVIRAIGTSKKNIRKMVFSEALVLALVGVGLGITLAVLVGFYTSIHGIDFSGMFEEQGSAGVLMDPLIKSIWDISGMITFSIGMIIVSLLSSLYPAHRVMKIQPSDAMRIY